jgi:hypothetical protein
MRGLRITMKICTKIFGNPLEVGPVISQKKARAVITMCSVMEVEEDILR